MFRFDKRAHKSVLLILTHWGIFPIDIDILRETEIILSNILDQSPMKYVPNISWDGNNTSKAAFWIRAQWSMFLIYRETEIILLKQHSGSELIRRRLWCTWEWSWTAVWSSYGSVYYYYKWHGTVQVDCKRSPDWHITHSALWFAEYSRRILKLNLTMINRAVLYIDLSS